MRTRDLYYAVVGAGDLAIKRAPALGSKDLYKRMARRSIRVYLEFVEHGKDRSEGNAKSGPSRSKTSTRPKKTSASKKTTAKKAATKKTTARKSTTRAKKTTARKETTSRPATTPQAQSGGGGADTDRGSTTRVEGSSGSSSGPDQPADPRRTQGSDEA